MKTRGAGVTWDTTQRPVRRAPAVALVRRGRAAENNQRVRRVMIGEEKAMRKETKVLAQPEPFTPGVTKGMVRQHAFELYRDKLPTGPLTLEDWVLAEKDLVASLETDGVARR